MTILNVQDASKKSLGLLNRGQVGPIFPNFCWISASLVLWELKLRGWHLSLGTLWLKYAKGVWKGNTAFGALLLLLALWQLSFQQKKHPLRKVSSSLARQMRTTYWPVIKSESPRSQLLRAGISSPLITAAYEYMLSWGRQISGAWGPGVTKPGLRDGNEMQMGTWCDVWGQRREKTTRELTDVFKIISMSEVAMTPRWRSTCS